MLDIVAAVAIEAGKAFFGELGKAGARALLSRDPELEPEAEPEQVRNDPVADAEEVGLAFLYALSQHDQDTAWTYCDPDWPHDPERSQSYHETFGAAPPASWNIREHYVPSDWRNGNDLPWVGLDVLVTFDLLDGSYSTLHGILWIFNINGEWRLTDINWDPDGSRATVEAQQTSELSIEEFFQGFDQTEGVDFTVHESQPTKRVIVCTRCPQKLSIPVGVGRIRVKCPSCWTTQVLDS
jgi:hypothetical protein